jgi:hypothetical protein
MRAHPWLIATITVIVGLILFWVMDSYVYDRDLERDAAYERTRT